MTKRTYQRKFHLLYKTTCIPTGHFYIGIHSTDNPFDGYLGSGTILWRSIKKHGKDNHQIEYLDIFTTRKDLLYAEKILVNSDLLKNDHCMNIRPGGQGVIEIKESSRKGQKLCDEHRMNISAGRKGIKFSEEHRRNISKAQTGRKLTDEWKENIGKSCKGKPSTNTRPIVVDGVEYPDQYTASRIAGIKVTTIGKRILSKSDKFKDTYYADSPKDNNEI